MKSSVEKKLMGHTADGRAVDLYILTNANGLRAKIMTYGATLIAVETPDRNGKVENITLALDNLDEYLKGHPCFGSTVGRFANRIARGKLVIDGKQYSLATNNGVNHLHGGDKGFLRVVWDAEPVETSDSVGVTFSYDSPDGDDGYPGHVLAKVTYRLTKTNDLSMEYSATTDQATVVNMTNHAYWNMGGGRSGDTLQQELWINADHYLPTDAGLIPTGEIRSVQGTPLDFTKPKPLGAEIAKTDGGYDHCFVINRKPGDKPLCLAARAIDPKSGRAMEVYTTEPGVQLYSGNCLDGSRTMDGKPLELHAGFCLEAQQFPDSPNKPNFPSTLLLPGEKYEQITRHRFYTV